MRILLWACAFDPSALEVSEGWPKACSSMRQRVGVRQTCCVSHTDGSSPVFLARGERSVAALTADGKPAKEYTFDYVFGPTTPTDKVSMAMGQGWQVAALRTRQAAVEARRVRTTPVLRAGVRGPGPAHRGQDAAGL